METGFSRHTIADVRDWKKANRLEIQPAFQRGNVWNPPARVMLIDSILKNIPLPKIFIGTIIKSGSTHRIVIDGQQRISSILDFLGNKFALNAPYNGPHAGKYFKDLEENVQNQILSYNLDFNEFQNYTDEEIRNIYHRVNKYTIALNKQELRRADFPGDFLDLSEKLSSTDYLDDAKVFTPANRRRLGDVEYISELLAVLINGTQDKKETLDQFYMDYSAWGKNEKESCEDRFLKIIHDIKTIFDESLFPIRLTRFKQKADFYSLFSAINDLHIEGRKINGDLLEDLREDLNFLDKSIEPGAPKILGEYAVRCVSDANSLNSRKWRSNFIKNFLYSAYLPLIKLSTERLEFFRGFIGLYDSFMCGPATDGCPICGEEVEEYEKGVTWGFLKKSLFIENARLGHSKCFSKSNSGYAFLDED